MRILVRTWHKVRVDGQKEFQEKNFLKSVELPDNAVEQILQWAKDYQTNLLIRKYKKPALTFSQSQSQDHLVAMNRIFRQLQEDGLNSEDERLAIGFLLGQYRDNPELIDLQVASRFFVEIEQERQTA